MTLKDLFERDVTRAIPPVVYFHEQDPQKLQSEVDEYIVTGGYADGHPNKKRVPVGIHEQYVTLLGHIAAELDKPGGPELPTAWISGFYGSGKSSFAKLIGLALDRSPTVMLPDGRALGDALIARDQSPHKAALRAAYDALLSRITPLSVVFDVGGTARDHEHIHAVAVRQVQRRLGYSQSDPHVADFELRLEKDGEWERFRETAKTVLGVDWDEVKNKALAEEDFSLVLSVMFPKRYPEPTAWYASRGSARRDGSPQDATLAIRDMLSFRAPAATLFLVVDEVSQYVVGNQDRIDRLRAFATELGAVMKGKVWLVALGQQKLDEQSDQLRLSWLKDRFPPKLQLHLAPTNIRDVIHRRLLAKKPAAATLLRELFEQHRSALKLYAYGASELLPDDFVEVYPLLPNHIELLLQITSALRQRTSRAQGDDHGIRGVLQLLGELFRGQGLADAEVGALVTFDQIYEVIHTALDSDLQASMARVLNATVSASELHVRAAKVVALLEHIQEVVPTSAELVAQCLYDKVDRGDRVAEVTNVLEWLKQKNLLGYGEKTGYKIQSSSAEEWEQEKERIGVSREQRAELVKDALSKIVTPPRAVLGKRPFPWRVTFATRLVDDGVLIQDARDQAAMAVDLRWLTKDERAEPAWVRRSAEVTLATRLVWVAGDDAQVDDLARELARSRDMVARYRPRRESLVVAKKNLLNHEEARAETLSEKLVEELGQQFVSGRLYFAGRVIDPREHGQSFGVVMTAAANRLLPEIFQQFEAVDVAPSQIEQLLEDSVSGIGSQFISGPLALFEQEAGRFVATATGTIPTRILDLVRKRNGMSGSALLTTFAAPPYAWTAYMVQAAVAGLVRAAKLKIQPEDGVEVTRLRDPGVRDLFKKERAFRAADFFPANEPVDPRLKAKVARLFEEELGVPAIEREEEKLVDAVAELLPRVVRRGRLVIERFARLPAGATDPGIAAVKALVPAAEQLIAGARYTEQTMTRLQKDLDVLRDGLRALTTFEAELKDEAVLVLNDARRVALVKGEQLRRVPGVMQGRPEVEQALGVIDGHLRSERPWLELERVTAAMGVVEGAYRAERERMAQWQELAADAARGRIRVLPAFVGLTADAQNAIMRVFRKAESDVDVGSTSPELLALGEPYAKLLRELEDEAFDALESVLEEAEKKKPKVPGDPDKIVRKPLVKVALRWDRREVASAEDVDRLLLEIRDTLMEQVGAGKRVLLG